MWMAMLLVPPGTSYCIRLVDVGEGAHIPRKISNRMMLFCPDTEF